MIKAATRIEDGIALVFARDGICTEKPVVTVGMCVRNCEGLVREAIGSILRQSYPRDLTEVVVVDDGSEDKTLSIVLDIFSNLDVEVLVFHSKWRGLGGARSTVVENARGKYIVWVDSDMILPQNHIQLQVNFMERNPEVGIGKARYSMFDEKSTVAFLENLKFVIEDEIAPKLPGTGGSIYRVNSVRQVGGFDKRLTGTGEDEDVAFRIKAAGWKISRTYATFIERRSRLWKDLWNKYFWYGYGDFQLYLKNRRIFSLTRMNPLSGLILGMFYSVMAHRVIHSRRIILFPFHFAFKMTAWCAGFAKCKTDSI